MGVGIDADLPTTFAPKRSGISYVEKVSFPSSRLDTQEEIESLSCDVI